MTEQQINHLLDLEIENANRAKSDGFITPENLEPYPKNPLIANFFRNIGFADKLGSGTRKIFKYTHLYSGENPEFIEGDVFRIIVPLDENYSFDSDDESSRQKNYPENAQKTEQVTEQVKSLLDVLKQKPLSVKEILAALNLHHRPTLLENYIKPAVALGLVRMTNPDSPNSPKQKYMLVNHKEKQNEF